MLNDPIYEDQVKVEDEPSLLFAEHDAGSYLVAEKIVDLRIEDAARYLWITTLNLIGWQEMLDKHIAALSSGDPLPDMPSDFSDTIEQVSTEVSQRNRKIANKIWVKWISSSTIAATKGLGGNQEARRRASLTLGQTSEFLDQANRKKLELDLRADGQGSTVEIPIISIPLQLRDAVLIAPWILVLCGLSVVIYTGRALQCAPKTSSDAAIVGNLPSFYAFYGMNKRVGIAVSIFLLILPSILMAVLLPVLIPGLISSWNSLNILYFLGVIFSLSLNLFSLTQIPQVLKLIDSDISIKRLP